MRGADRGVTGHRADDPGIGPRDSLTSRDHDDGHLRIVALVRQLGEPPLVHDTQIGRLVLEGLGKGFEILGGDDRIAHLGQDRPRMGREGIRPGVGYEETTQTLLGVLHAGTYRPCGGGG
jgi:hypothetical protein